MSKPNPSSIALLCGMLFSVLTLTGCPGLRCGDIVVQQHDLPAYALTYVPYDSITQFEMKHSAGSVTRFSRTATGDGYEFWEECAECCREHEIQYRNWNFSGDGPGIDFGVSLAVAGHPVYEPGVCRFNINLSRLARASYSLYPDSALPVPRNYSSQAYTLLDSAVIQGVSYPEVFQIFFIGDSNSIFLDSLWYNKAHGLLKFSMSNNENWELLP
jgi:hypothetical protein